jgi:hypothetical protein
MNEMSAVQPQAPARLMPDQDPFVLEMVDRVCASVGGSVDSLTPLYRRLACAAMSDAELLVLTYLVSQNRNMQARRARGGRKQKDSK